ATPVIHRFEVGVAGAIALSGIDVGVPTLDVVATPPLAATLDIAPDEGPLDERFLYAIDATNGSVLVVDYSAGSPNFGAVLAVSFGAERSDRLAYREPARALSVITPELYRSEETTALCDPSDAGRAGKASTGQLRGVYLAVALETGAVAIVDIWDLEANCRGGENCENPRIRADDEVAIRRHRPRIASFVSDEARPTVSGSPALSFETNPGILGVNGRPSTGSGPGLAQIDCGGFSSPMLQGFPSREDAQTSLICILDDPWAGANQRFTATFDGAIPFTSGGNGLLVNDGTLRFEAPNAIFCNAGVLGRADVIASSLDPSVDPEAGYGGDQLELTGDLPPSTESKEECAAFDLEPGETFLDRDPIRFQIIEARQDSLVLAPLGDTDEALVRHCFPRATSYRVRVRDAYVVLSSSRAVAHRVVSDSGACRVDTASFPVVPGDPNTYRNFRAIARRTFVHPLVAFQITDAGANQDRPVDLDESSQLVFDVSRYPSKLAVTVGTLIESMRWNPTDDRLYVVDSGAFRVAQISTDSYGVLRYFD
ncbi:MAG: hypothetical protein H5U40_16885, partial [Polyangiaceae bacterium]|nr:hypothetical protein [Polyangiaceae bacterium]